MPKRIYGIVLSVSLCVFMVSCASSGGAAAGDKGRPSWIERPPEDSANAVFFVGAGSDTAGDAAKARELANADLVSNISKFLGVKITAETTTEAKDSIKEFENKLTNTIREQSKAQISDLKITDTYTERSGNTVNVYVLGEYNKKSLLAEQARIKRIFEEQAEAISGPEKAGDDLFRSGSFFQAAVKYIEAAVAATASDVDNADIKFKRNMDKAKSAISSINFYALNSGIHGMSGQPLPEPFRLKVSGGSSPNAAGLSGVPVLIGYKELKSNGKMGAASAEVQTDAEGMVSFSFPAVQRFVGTERVTMSLNMMSTIQPLENVPKKYQDQVDSLKQAVNAKRVVFEYVLASAAKTIPTAVLIIDTDNGNAPTGKTETAAGVLEALSAEKFNAALLPYDAVLASMDEASAVDYLKNKYGKTYERLIFGTATISDFSEKDGKFTVKVSGNIQAYDLKSGQVLYSSGNTFKSALGNNLSAAMSAAYKQFGKLIGEGLVNALP